MKRCEYCDSLVPDFENECPYCAGRSFAYGEAPSRGKASQFDASKNSASGDALNANSNKNLGRNVIVTLFMPMIGGYFLIKPGVKRGAFWFAIIWCIVAALLMAAFYGNGAATHPEYAGTYIAQSVITALLCLCPIFYYFAKYKLGKGELINNSLPATTPNSQSAGNTPAAVQVSAEEKLTTQIVKVSHDYFTQDEALIIATTLIDLGLGDIKDFSLLYGENGSLFSFCGKISDPEIIGDHQVNIVTQDHELCDVWMTRFTFTDPLTFKMADRSMELFNIDEGGCAGFYDSSRHMVYRYDDREKVGKTV